MTATDLPAATITQFRAEIVAYAENRGWSVASMPPSGFTLFARVGVIYFVSWRSDRQGGRDFERDNTTRMRWLHQLGHRARTWTPSMAVEIRGKLR